MSLRVMPILLAVSAGLLSAPVLAQPGPPTPGVTVDNTVLNPVPVNSADLTRLLHDSFVSIAVFDYRDNPQIGPIDVSGFKTVRVVLRRGSCSPCPIVEPRAYIRAIGTASSEPRTIDKVTIDNADGDIGKWASRTYDTPGTSLQISFEGESGRQSQVRVMVFGRAN
jgi:hypothetical protein